MVKYILELKPQYIELHVPLQIRLKSIVITKDGLLRIRDEEGRIILELLIAEKRAIEETGDY